LSRSLPFHCCAVALIPLLAAAALMTGALDWQQLQSSDHQQVLSQYRVPRILLAILAGAGLGLSGAMLQTITRNPLASPDIIGITQGAGLAATALLIYLPTISFLWLLPAAISGALFAAVAIWWLGRQLQSQPAKLVLVGIAMATFLGAITDWLLTLNTMQINSALVWLTGSLWGRGWHHINLLLPSLLILLPLALSFAYRLDLLALGDEAASSLGTSVKRIRVQALSCSVMLAAVSVAVCGTISFIGLVAPHLARLLVGSRHKYLLPYSAITGALLLLLADTLARGLMPPIELPAGLITAMIGAPYFLFLLSRYRGW